jgi:hypothetical protein
MAAAWWTLIAVKDSSSFSVLFVSRTVISMTARTADRA